MKTYVEKSTNKVVKARWNYGSLLYILKDGRKYSLDTFARLFRVSFVRKLK